jgi:hypothetical protein
MACERISFRLVGCKSVFEWQESNALEFRASRGVVGISSSRSVGAHHDFPVFRFVELFLGFLIAEELRL